MKPYSSFFVSRTRDVLPAFTGYMRGLFQSERVNLLRMSEVNEVDHQTMQYLLTDAEVNWEGFGDQIAKEADVLLGGSDSVLVLDESAFAKKGRHSAGVGRQWNGRLGKVDNCQVGVFATLCRGEMASLVDARLYLPHYSWTEDDARCHRAAIPAKERRYRSKTELALEMVKTARWRGLRFGTMVVDGGYGKEPAFLRGLDALRERFLADVHCDQTIYLQDPEPTVPAWSGRGKAPIHRKAKSPSLRVDRWAADQPPEAWQRLTMLGTLFLLKQKIQGRKQWPLLSFNDLVTALAHLLPRRQMTADELASIIGNRHRLRRQAKESHARRTKRALE